MSKGKKFLVYAGVGLAALIFAVIAASYSWPENNGPVSSGSQGSMLKHQSASSMSNLDSRTSDYAPPPTASAPLMVEAMPESVGSSFGGSSDMSEGGNKAAQANQATVATQRKVVKEGALELVVKKAEDAAERSAAIAEGLGGYVEGKNIYNVSDESKAGKLTLKVPADKFDQALKQLKEIAIKVEREEVATSDVTAQYVDMEARLVSLKAEEAQYLSVLKEAKKVDDILNVTEHLSSVRSEVERMQAAIKELSGDVEMSSIAISLTEEADVQVFGLDWKPLLVLKQASRDLLGGLAGYADAMVAFFFFLPVLILWVSTLIVGLWVVRKIFRFVRMKFFASPTTP